MTTFFPTNTFNTSPFGALPWNTPGVWQAACNPQQAWGAWPTNSPFINPVQSQPWQFGWPTAHTNPWTSTFGVSPFQAFNSQPINPFANTLNPLAHNPTLPSGFNATNPFAWNATALHGFGTINPTASNPTVPYGLNTSNPFAFGPTVPYGFNTFNPFAFGPTVPYGFNTINPVAYNPTVPFGFNTINPVASNPTVPFGFNTINPVAYNPTVPFGFNTFNPVAYNPTVPFGFNTINPVAYNPTVPFGFNTFNPVAYNPTVPFGFSTTNPVAYNPAVPFGINTNNPVAYNPTVPFGFNTINPFVSPIVNTVSPLWNSTLGVIPPQVTPAVIANPVGYTPGNRFWNTLGATNNGTFSPVQPPAAVPTNTGVPSSGFVSNGTGYNPVNTTPSYPVPQHGPVSPVAGIPTQGLWGGTPFVNQWAQFGLPFCGGFIPQGVTPSWPVTATPLGTTVQPTPNQVLGTPVFGAVPTIPVQNPLGQPMGIPGYERGEPCCTGSVLGLNRDAA